MPVINQGGGAGGGNDRQTFRPPWVKDGPPALPMPSAPWIGSNAKRNSVTLDQPQMERPVLKKTNNPNQMLLSQVPSTTENGGQIDPPKPKLKPILKKQQASIDVAKPTVGKVIEEQKPLTKPTPPQQPPPPKQPSPVPTPPQKKTGPPPPPPPMKNLPGPPPPPPPAAGPPVVLENKKPLTETAKKRIDQLKSRPRRRPDWSDMMKEVEEGKKLRHVQCNDRSAPIISVVKENKGDQGDGQFVFESEKKDPNSSHNALLGEIQGGVKLKKVKTNDRSRPNLSGLRKFRRQETVDEKIKKSMSMADVVAVAVEPDELDDIDKVRDDLQSAKQMLALELRNKETLERENKKMAQKLAQLEAELENERISKQNAENTSGNKIVKVRTDEDEMVIKQLKETVEESEKTAKEMEERYHNSAEELDNTRRKLESAWLLNQELENQLKIAQQAGGNLIPIMKQPSRKLVMQNTIHGKSIEILSSDEDEDSDEEESETESDEESDNEEDIEAKEEKRKTREIKMLTTKLKTFKDKHEKITKERKKLRLEEKKQQRLLKEEKKKYKILQKEVDKMAKLMRESGSDDEEEDEEEEQQEPEESESESSSDSESSDESSDNELPENAPYDDRKTNLTSRAKKHESRLNSLKKGNYLLKANIDRLQDDLARQKDMSLQLQEDLNSVLADFG